MVRDLDLEGHEIDYMPSKDMELLIEELLRFKCEEDVEYNELRLSMNTTTR